MNKPPPTTASELLTKAAPPGRRLLLRFIGQAQPLLDRAEFHCEGTTRPGYWQQRDQDSDHSITWTMLPKTLSVFFLDYVCAGLQGRAGEFRFSGTRTGSPAATIGDAISKKGGKLFKLFVEFPKQKGAEYSRVDNVFDGINLDGGKKGERHIWIKTDYLPIQAVAISWEGSWLHKREDFQRLAAQIRKAEDLPPPSQLKLREGKGSQSEPEKQSEPHPEAKNDLPKADLATDSIRLEFKSSQPEPAAKKQDEPSPAKEKESEAKPEEPPPIPVSARFPDIDQHRGFVLTSLEGGCSAWEIWGGLKFSLDLEVEESRVKEYVEALLQEVFPPGKIKPKLFEIAEPERTWEDETVILPVPLENCPPAKWTIRDACQGTLIMGAPGSGKTTGSGRVLAFNLLSQGFGGLILTSKHSEVVDWSKLIAVANRARDAAVVCPTGYLRLNMLQYELERPSGGVKMAGNLVSFFKNLASVVGQHNHAQMNEKFWENTGNELLENTIECFMRSKLPITLDNLCTFILEAPKDKHSAQDGNWQSQPVFGACLMQVKAAVKDADDERMYKVLSDYWLNAYPTDIPDDTRACITTAFRAMVRALRSPHINDLLSTMTTITPESIFNGRIILLALPTNDYHDGGLLVQAAWKYLFQRAVLSRADRHRGENCRPVFLWEDEAQSFLIDNDSKFQPLCREYRAACVKLSQNISNFYAHFGGGDAARTKVDAILGSLNTRFFHANGDLATNEWASKLIGTEYKTVVNTSTTPAVYNGLNPFKSFLHDLVSKPTVTTSHNQVREPTIHPHEFQTLQTGNKDNGFVTHTVITQVGRMFESGLNYQLMPFQQTIFPISETEKVLGDQFLKK